MTIQSLLIHQGEEMEKKNIIDLNLDVSRIKNHEEYRAAMATIGEDRN